MTKNKQRLNDLVEILSTSNIDFTNYIEDCISDLAGLGASRCPGCEEILSDTQLFCTLDAEFKCQSCHPSRNVERYINDYFPKSESLNTARIQLTADELKPQEDTDLEANPGLKEAA